MLKSAKQAPVKKDWGNSFAVISPSIVKLEERETLAFPTSLTKKAHVRLIPKTSAQRVLLTQAQNGYWKIGQTFLTDKWCNIPFTRYLDLTTEKKDPIVQELLLK
jgi:hypothetical protein